MGVLPGQDLHRRLGLVRAEGGQAHLLRGKPVLELLDTNITQTLDRSIMTSLTTVLATVPMLFLVSTQLAQFVLPLMVGVLVGTYSSIFLCSPLYYEFNKGEEKSKYLAQ